MMIEVYDHKNIGSGDAAVVAYKKWEFELLKIYIRLVRVKFVGASSSPYVFLSSTTCPSNPDHQLSLPSVTKILGKTGKIMKCTTGSRVYRTSKVTKLRKTNPAKKHRRDQAKSYGHRVEVSLSKTKV